jgi:carboxypeptidase A2
MKLKTAGITSAFTLAVTGLIAGLAYAVASPPSEPTMPTGEITLASVQPDEQPAAKTAPSILKPFDEHGQRIEFEPSVRYDDHKLVRVNVRTQRELMLLLNSGAIPWACRVGVGPQEYAVSPEQRELIDLAGLEYEILAENLQRLFDEEAEAIAAARQQAIANDAWFEVYRTTAEVNDYIDELVNLRPDLVEKEVVGTSIQGRTIYGMRITAPGGAEKPAVFFNGMQHSREWIAVMVPMYIADQLVRNYGSDPRITAILDNVEIYIIPIVNPDGYEFSQTPGNRMWRKNRRNNPGSSCFGVDLNRNWDIDYAGPHSTSTNPCSDIFIGSAAHSEPEVAAVVSYVQARPNIAAHIDFHNFSELVLHPWGYTNTPHPEADNIIALGNMMSDAIYSVHGRNYTVGTPGQVLYMVSGSMQDWTTTQGAYGYTIELRPATSNPGFQLPPEQIVPTCEENVQAALVMAEFVAQGVVFSFPDDLPGIVDAGGNTTTTVQAAPVSSGPLDHSSAELHYRIGSSGSFTSVPMTWLGGDQYEATFPPTPCGSTIEYYFEIDSQSGTSYQSPLGAPSNVYTATSANIVVVELLSEDFASGLPSGWSATGLWNVTSACPVSGQCEPQWAYYGQTSGCNYDAGTNSGILTSPLISIPALNDGETAELRFCYNLETEDNASYDKAELSIASGPWIRMDEAATWTTYTADVSGLAGQSINIRWRFDTVDGLFNNFRGWQVTNVTVIVNAADCPDCPADLNGDGVVNVADLLILFDNWGENPGSPADLNGDGVVNVADLLILFDGWGECD